MSRRELPGVGSRSWWWTGHVWAPFLSLLLVAFLFEGAVHSVHHLDSDDEATGCWVASAAGSLSIVSPDAIALDHFRLVAIGLTVDSAPSAPALRPLGVSHERAPPSAPSA